ncbi:hypothetical protein C0993_005183 [Termitomyces sp. T159_Od127]|nr:hypothetical protein C0993_005183 [Termitomyces sp. T159_Od127]
MVNVRTLVEPDPSQIYILFKSSKVLEAYRRRRRLSIRRECLEQETIPVRLRDESPRIQSLGKESRASGACGRRWNSWRTTVVDRPAKYETGDSLFPRYCAPWQTSWRYSTYGQNIAGGGYIIPLQDFSASFWNYVRLKLGNEGTNAGFAIMSYCEPSANYVKIRKILTHISPAIIPTAQFPTQFVQAIEALQHVIMSGCNPEDIYIVGDSAGGNLALALLSHMLHPVESLPPISLTSRIGGVFLMSPWVSLTGDTGSHLINDSLDIVGAKTFAYCGRKVLEDVPDSLRVYLEMSKVPDTWFKGIDKLVNRILVTAGGVECLRDDIIQVSHKLSQNHSNVRLIVQENGVHDDPFFDFFAGEMNLCDLTPKILGWLRQALNEAKN